MEELKGLTHTNIFNQPKKLYAIYEWTLPAPVTFRQLGLFVLGALVWCPLMFILGVPISTSFGFMIWVSAPVALAVFGSKPIYEDKNIFEYIGGVVNYFGEPKRIMDGRGVSKDELMDGDLEEEDPGRHHFEISAWKKVK